MGQGYFALCIALNKTPRELGELRRRDPLVYEYLERALYERYRPKEEEGG
jgi:hypothetical protein